MSLKNIIVSPDTLTNYSILNTEVDECLKGLMININDELKCNRDNSEMITELPTVFSITGLNNREAQIKIWSSIIRLLRDKKYIVKISFNKSFCKLYISWKHLQKSAVEKYEYDLIKENIMSSDEMYSRELKNKNEKKRN